MPSPAASLALTSLLAQQPSSGELARRIEHLRVVGRVLYVAAHPDDENTRLLAYLVGERGLDATYLSLTRGGGGQNLVGTEQAELLGVIRTGELLAARAIDGAEQRFTRARDFGYSKSADEALAFWGRDEILHDVVRAVREVRPDVIVTRFGPDDDTHGHHVASAILAAEAFALAADPAHVTEGLAPWQADRIVRNESSWRIDHTTDTTGWLRLDVGGYDPLTGRSWGEVAAASRTMHKSQGFGSAPSVGPQLEYFSAIAGDVPAPGEDLFQGLDLGWSRFEGAKAVDKALARAANGFDPRRPEATLPDLAVAHALLDELDAGPWGARKQAELAQVMAACAGLWVTARADPPAVAPGAEVEVTLTALARAEGADVDLSGVPEALTLTAPLAPTRPHWLAEAPTAPRYTIEEGPWRTAPDTPASLVVPIEVTIAGRALSFAVPVQHAWTDPVAGERRHDVEVLPPVTATFGRRARLVPAGQAVEIPLTLRAEAGPAEGVLKLVAPEGGSVVPSQIRYALTEEAPEQIVTLSVTPGDARGALVVEGAFARAAIDHPHLPRRTVLSPASLDVVPVDLDRGGVERVAYVMGSGDEVDAALRDLGYAVDLVDEDTIASGGLAGYDAVVLGVRALNTRPRLLDLQGPLLDYVATGGRVIVQYNTSSSRRRLPPFGPAPLTLGRGRVTDETAAMVPIDPADPVLTAPNALGEADAAGWVQERGLYFGETWDPAWRPVLRMHDAGEVPLEGALLVARHGDGVFVYTGLSLFRQLPAGVPGAARLLANLLAVP